MVTEQDGTPTLQTASARSRLALMMPLAAGIVFVSIDAAGADASSVTGNMPLKLNWSEVSLAWEAVADAARKCPSFLLTLAPGELSHADQLDHVAGHWQSGSASASQAHMPSHELAGRHGSRRAVWGGSGLVIIQAFAAAFLQSWGAAGRDYHLLDRGGPTLQMASRMDRPGSAIPRDHPPGRSNHRDLVLLGDRW